jgi:hypothetical protein
MEGAVSKVCFLPPTPLRLRVAASAEQGRGALKMLVFNKSPLGVPIAIRIGVDQKRGHLIDPQVKVRYKGTLTQRLSGKIH